MKKKTIHVRGLFVSMFEAKFLFVNTEKGKHFFVDLENIEGDFFPDCEAIIEINENGIPFAKIKPDEKKYTGKKISKNEGGLFNVRYGKK